MLPLQRHATKSIDTRSHGICRASKTVGRHAPPDDGVDSILVCNTVKLPHAARETAVRRFHEQLVIVAHRAVSVPDPRVADSGTGLPGCQT